MPVVRLPKAGSPRLPDVDGSGVLARLLAVDADRLLPILALSREC